LTVTAAVPVEVTVTDFVTGVPTATLPNANEVALRLRAGVAALSRIAKLFDDASALAETVAACEVVTEATFAVNDVVEAPEATVTPVGTVTALLLLATVTLTPVEGAAALSDTLHVVVPAPVKEVLPHEKALIEGADGDADPLRLIEVVLEVVPWVAVRVTVCEEVTADTLATKLALAAPAGTETESGTDTELLLLASLTAVPLLGASSLNLTVHVSDPELVIDEVVQLRPVSVAGEEDPLPCSLTVPPAPPEERVLASTLS
jgi:hypothetical protein